MMSSRVVTIARGEDLIAGLAAACTERDGWIQASGSVEAVEIRVAGEDVDRARVLRGRLTLAALSGPAGGPYGVTLARATDAGLEVIAGELVRARSDGVVAILLSAAREPSVAAEEAQGEKTARDAPGKKAGPAASNWAAAALATASQALGRAEPEPEPLVPEPGDLVQHFAFGLCEVLMGDDERLKIRDVTGPGRIREIHLDKLSVKGPADREGKRLFRLERKG